MTAVATRTRRPRPPDRGDRARTLMMVGLAGAVGIAVAGAPTLGRVILGTVGLGVVGYFTVTNRDLAVSLMLVWLTLLGFVRRLLIPFIGYSPIDPLLLVSPAAAAMLLIYAYRKGSRPPKSVHSALCTFLFVWIVAQLFNPEAPNLYVNLQASMFYVTPLLWFFVGRSLHPGAHRRVLDTLFWATVPVVALGMYHSLVGFFNFEYTWIGVSGQSSAIFLPGFRIRPFSTLVSPQEYGHYLSISLAIILGRLFYATTRRTWLLAYFGVTFLALFFQASRTNMLLALLAIVTMVIVKLRSLIGVVALVGMVGLVGVLTIRADVSKPVDQVSDPAATDPGKTEVLAQHQLAGLTNPGDSTAGLHFDLIGQAFDEAFANPLGTGIGRGTLAAAKQRDFASAESDLPNVTAGMGIPAGIALGLLYLTTLIAALRLQLLRPSARHLAWLGILMSGINQWWTGNLYSVSTIIFLVIGGISVDWANRRRLPAVEPPVDHWEADDPDGGDGDGRGHARGRGVGGAVVPIRPAPVGSHNRHRPPAAVARPRHPVGTGRVGSARPRTS